MKRAEIFITECVLPALMLFTVLAFVTCWICEGFTNPYPNPHSRPHDSTNVVLIVPRNDSQKGYNITINNHEYNNSCTNRELPVDIGLGPYKDTADKQ